MPCISAYYNYVHIYLLHPCQETIDQVFKEILLQRLKKITRSLTLVTLHEITVSPTHRIQYKTHDIHVTFNPIYFPLHFSSEFINLEY